MAGVITASEPSWIAPFTGLSPRQFGKLITALRREGADPVRKGRPWSLPLEDRVLLVAAYWRTNLTLRQLAPLFGVSKSSADRIVDHLGPAFALQSRRRFRKDTVLIVDGVTHDVDFTNKPTSSCANKYDIRSVGTHEAGHVFGLGHVGSGHENLTMYTESFECKTIARTLGKGDVLALRSIY